jgi:hypothetical protein
MYMSLYTKIFISQFLYPTEEELAFLCLPYVNKHYVGGKRVMGWGREIGGVGVSNRTVGFKQGTCNAMYKEPTFQVRGLSIQ